MVKAGSLIVEIGANVAKIKNDLEQVHGHVSGFASGVKKVLTGMGIGMIARQLVNTIRDTATSMRQISQIAHSVGTSSEKFSALSYAAGQAGLQVETLKIGYRNLARAMGDTSRGLDGTAFAFSSLGINIKDAHGNFRDTSDVLMDVADRFGQMEDSTLKSYYAIKLFGRSGTDLVPVLDSGRKGIERWIAEAKDFNVVISDEAAASIETMMRAFDRLKASGTGSLRAITSGLSDAMTQIANSWTILTKGSSELKDLGGIIGSIAKIANVAALTVIAAFKWAQNSIVGTILTIPTQINKVIDLVNQAYERVSSQASGDEGFFGAVARKKEIIPRINVPKIDFGDIKSKVDEDIKKYIDSVKKLYATIENIPISDVATGGGGAFAMIDEKAIKKVDDFKEKVDKLIESLKFERFILQQTSEAQAGYNILKQAGFEIDEKTGEVKQKQFEGQAKELMVLGEQVRVLESVKGALKALETTQEKNANLQKDLDVAYKNGWITLQEYQKVLESFKEKQEKQAKEIKKTQKEIVDMNSVLKSYMEEISNFSKQAGDSIVSSFKKAEDTLVDFVMTGKLKLSDFFNFIKTEIARLAIRQAIIAPLAGFLVGSLGAGFGGAGGGGAGAGASGTMVAHSGGVIGHHGLIPASAYAHAPRYHQGLRSNERPAILEVGEEVIPKNQVGRGLTVAVGPINIAERNPRLQSDLRREIEETVIRVVRSYS